MLRNKALLRCLKRFTVNTTLVNVRRQTNEQEEVSSVKSLSKKFYKLVHPDKFSKYQKEKETNEHSLKRLISLINALSGDITASDQQASHIHSLDESYHFIFYLFDKTSISDDEKFKMIKSDFNSSPLKIQSSGGNIFSHLQNELKKTLINLFSQANLPCNIKMEKIEREAFWEQTPSEIDLVMFLNRYARLAQERAEIRLKKERKISIYRSAFHFRKKLIVQTDLPDIMYKQSNMIDIPLYGNSEDSTDFVEPLVNTFSAASDVFGEEYLDIQLNSLEKLVTIIDKCPDEFHNCVTVFSDTPIPHRVDNQGRIHLHYKQSADDWMEVIKSIQFDQMHRIKYQNREIKHTEGALAYRLGLKYISASSFDVSTTKEYQDFLQRLIEATNSGLLTADDFGNGLYKRLSLVIIPCRDNIKDKYFTGDSNGLLIPFDCTIDRLKDFIKNHSNRMKNQLIENAKQDEKEVILNF